MIVDGVLDLAALGAVEWAAKLGTESVSAECVGVPRTSEGGSTCVAARFVQVRVYANLWEGIGMPMQILMCIQAHTLALPATSVVAWFQRHGASEGCFLYLPDA